MTDLNKLNEAIQRGDMREIWNTICGKPEDIYKTRCQEIVSPGVHCWRLHPCEDHGVPPNHQCPRCGDPIEDGDRVYCDLCRGWQGTEL